MTTRHPLRIQRKRTKGYLLPPGAVSITRPGPWGNPFRTKSAIEAGYAQTEDEARALCVEAFGDWMHKGDLAEWWFGDLDRWLWVRSHLSELYGRQLACWCPLDRPCHGDVLAAAAEAAEPWPEIMKGKR